jgi:hypothetical protein
MIALVHRLIFNLLARKEPVYVVSHERSGTHFAINTLFQNTYVRPRLFYVGDWPGPYDRPETRWAHIEAFSNTWETEKLQGGLIKSHCDARIFAGRFPSAPVVYVMRDPRDTLVSFFHYLNNDELYRTNPGLADQRCRDFSEFLRRPASDYLRLGFFEQPDFDNVVGRWASHVCGWMTVPGVCLVRYEDLKKDYQQCVRTICRKTGIWPRFRQQPVGLGDRVSVLPRKGIVGDWRSHFRSGDEEFVETELNKYNLSLADWAATRIAENRQPD